jgi:hypothetical protein
MTARTRILTALAAALIAVGTLPADSLAGSRGKHRKAPAKGASSGSVHRETTRTGPDGQTRTRQKDTTWERGDGQATRDTTWTGANGKTATRHTDAQKTGDGHTTHSTTTGPGGKTSTRDATVVNDREAGMHTKDVTRTGPEGQISTRHTEVQKTDDGRASATTVTRPDGSTTTRSSTLSRTPAPGEVEPAEAPAAE